MFEPQPKFHLTGVGVSPQELAKSGEDASLIPVAPPARFPTTIWSRMSEVRRHDPRALDDLARAYRPPVVLFARRTGFSAEDSEDLAQEVFIRLLSSAVLETADRKKGRFRTLVLAVTRHVIADFHRDRYALKRGGGVVHVTLEAAEQVLRAPEERDDGFDRDWANNLVALALEQLRLHCETGGKPYHKTLTVFLELGTYAKVAQALGIAEAQVKKYLHRARGHVLQSIRDRIAFYASSREEYEEDLARLRGYFPFETE